MIGEGRVPHKHPAALERRHAVANHLDGAARHRRPDRLAHLSQEFPGRCWSARHVPSDPEVTSWNLHQSVIVASNEQSPPEPDLATSRWLNEKPTLRSESKFRFRNARQCPWYGERHDPPDSAAVLHQGHRCDPSLLQGQTWLRLSRHLAGAAGLRYRRARPA